MPSFHSKNKTLAIAAKFCGNTDIKIITLQRLQNFVSMNRSIYHLKADSIELVPLPFQLFISYLISCLLGFNARQDIIHRYYTESSFYILLSLILIYKTHFSLILERGLTWCSFPTQNQRGSNLQPEKICYFCSK